MWPTKYALPQVLRHSGAGLEPALPQTRESESAVEAEIARLKRQAAERAVEFVESGMVVGLGHGTTALFAIRRIGELLRKGQLRDILGVPCAIPVTAEAQRVGIPLTTLEERPAVDLTIDGADEVTAALEAIKGGGGALLHEKIVAQATRREIIVVDDRKLTPVLGTRATVPVEVLSFGWRSQLAYLESLGARVTVRGSGDGRPFRTEEGNLVLDCQFGPIAEPTKLAAQLEARAGVVGHGMFLGLITDAIVAGAGGLRHLKRGDPQA